jgi:hypothetical protein
MDTPSETKAKADADAHKMSLQLEDFLERVVMPVLVDRYMQELRRGKRPTTKGSVAAVRKGSLLAF